MTMYSTSQVFGVSTAINSASYVDRNRLDSKIGRLLRRDTHIALKGASKSGKSWLRQRCIPESVVVQCRYNMEIGELYRTVLRELGVEIETSRMTVCTCGGEISGEGKAKLPFMAQGGVAGSTQFAHERETEHDTLQDANDLKFIAEKVKASGKRLIIEDFHYMSEPERQKFAYDLKTLWDYGCYVIIVGVWTQTNLLTFMNPDLTARIEEVPIFWSDDELREVIDKGCEALNIYIDERISEKVIQDSFGNVGVLQSLLLKLVEDIAEIEKTCDPKRLISDEGLYQAAAQAYASQLDGVYQQFAKLLSAGIRQRKNATGIYALTLQAIVEADDGKLREGFKRADIYEITHKKEPRIQKGNLKTVLQKLGELQHNSYQGNLVVTYDDSIDAVSIVDMQLLFYRKYHTMVWPWEEIADEVKQMSLLEEDEDI